MPLTVTPAPGGSSGGGGGAISGTYAARPAPGVPGRVHVATDRQIISVDTGTTWDESASPPASALYPVTPPKAAALWTPRNATATTIVDVPGGVHIDYTGPTANHLAGFEEPVTAPLTVVAQFYPLLTGLDISGCGIYVAIPGNSKIYALGWSFQAAAQTWHTFTADRWTSATAISAEAKRLVTSPLIIPMHPTLVRIQVDAANIRFAYGNVAGQFREIYSEALSSWLGVGAVVAAGMYVRKYSYSAATAYSAATFTSWKVT